MEDRSGLRYLLRSLFVVSLLLECKNRSFEFVNQELSFVFTWVLEEWLHGMWNLII